ncbi:HNH endonuclease [bacterium]|nr:HNH endonuclease [bacterium]RQV95273.1 MAG: HNH endonuclease [bacterium]
MLDSRVLVLNQNYEPMSVCSARRAIVLLYLQKAEMIERNHEIVHSMRTYIPLPSIVRLSRLIHVPRKRILLNRKNIIKRDNHQCQYCGSKEGSITVDHVIPKDQGGEDTWENLVCACMRCNTKKRNRTPREAGMKLLKKPRKPGYPFFIQHLIGIPDDRWKPYLFMS